MVLENIAPLTVAFLPITMRHSSSRAASFMSLDLILDVEEFCCNNKTLLYYTRQARNKAKIMLVFLTLFFTLLCVWIILFIFNSTFNAIYLLLGIFFSFLIANFTVKSKLMNRQNTFLFLQFGFYKFIFKKINLMFLSNLYLCYQILSFKQSIRPTVDYLFMDNEDMFELALMANILNASPGILCILLKKKYFVIHSLGDDYFIPSDLYFLNLEVGKVHDDVLV